QGRGEARDLCTPPIEIRADGSDDERGIIGTGDRIEDRIDELAARFLVAARREELLELVDHENGNGSAGFADSVPHVRERSHGVYAGGQDLDPVSGTVRRSDELERRYHAGSNERRLSRSRSSDDNQEPSLPEPFDQGVHELFTTEEE